MRTWNNEIGKKIIKIVYEHRLDGIGYNKLKRNSGYAKNTIDRWLNRLRNFGIIKQTPKYPIYMTKKAIQEYEKNSLFIPYDVRRRQKNIWSEKEKKSIIHILSLMTIGVYKPRYNIPKSSTGLYRYRNKRYPFYLHKSIIKDKTTNILYL
ncbi:MAG TPA: hypothetical protein VLA74_09255 [Nitrososphaeraceae archaeon]|nr:hypothetical protein [Nitrososphaeraceae archaeon]